MSFENKDPSKQQTYKGSFPPTYPPERLIKPGKGTFKNKGNGLEKWDINSKSSQATAEWAARINPFNNRRTFVGTEQGVIHQTSGDIMSRSPPSLSVKGPRRRPFANPNDANSFSINDLQETGNENASTSNDPNENKEESPQTPIPVVLDVFSIRSLSYDDIKKPTLSIRWRIPFSTGVPHKSLEIFDSAGTQQCQGAYCISEEGGIETLELLTAKLNEHSLEMVHLIFELRKVMSDK